MKRLREIKPQVVPPGSLTASSGAESVRITKGVWLFSLIVTLALFGTTVLKAWTFYANAFDLGFFVQAIGRIKLSDLTPATSVAGFGLLEDHLSLLVVPFAPFARIGWAGLLALQSLAVGVSFPLVWRFARRTGMSSAASWSILAGYAAAPVLLYAVWFDFHTSLLALPFLVLLAEGVELRETKEVVIGGIGASLAREDVALLVLAASVVFFWMDRRGLGITAIASGGLLAISGLLRNPGWFRSNAYLYMFDRSLTEVAATIPVVVWYGGTLVVLVVGWITPWGAWKGLSLKPFIPGLLASMPFVLSFLPTNHTLEYQYYFFFAPLGVWGVVHANRQLEDKAQYVLYLGVVMLGLLLGPLGLSLLGPDAESLPKVARAFVIDRVELAKAHGVLACIPDDAVISAASPFVPMFAPSRDVMVWPVPFADLQLLTLVDPIVEADALPLRYPDVVVTAAEGWTRSGLFRAEVSSLPEHGYVRLPLDSDVVTAWAAPGYGAESMVDCMTSR